MNCLALEQRDGILVVDCGTSFPDSDLGIDVIHPDFRWLLDNVEQLSGVVITHGHEDHIGAVSYLLDEIDVPVWTPAHARALIERRLAERGFSRDEVRLRDCRVGQPFRVGPFEVEPIRVAHSITDATALAIRTAAGLVIHTGDFNFDPAPPDGEPTDEARLRALGDEGVQLLLSDSTNIDVPERPGSEQEVGEALREIVEAAEQRVFVVMFASNVQRLRCLGDIARETGRKLCLLGRSLGTHSEVAKTLDRLAWPSDLLVAPEQAQTLPRDQVLVLAGGSQAERSSAMRRLASKEHNQMSVEAGDDVVFSSRVIPGNERIVFAMMCDLLRLGARLHTRVTAPRVHTSGHAGRSEQRRMLELVRPQSFIPVHGTLHHLLRHADLAREQGVEHVDVIENGTTAICDPDAGLRRGPAVPVGKIDIALGGQPLDAETRRRRSDVARTGFVLLSLVVDGDDNLQAPPAVTARGVPSVDDDDDVLRSIAREIVEQLNSRRKRRRTSLPIEEQARRAARRVILDVSGVRPQIEVQVVCCPPRAR
ncbi:MAG: ribonuclease J [Polyangiaceae bacterium]